MNYHKDKVDDAVLALLFLTLHDEMRAWKGHDWGVLGRLHEKGLIENPVGKSESVVFTPEGPARSEALFRKHFGQAASS